MVRPAATGRLAQALNHDLRSLLTIILGYGDELRRSLRKKFLDDYAVEVDQIRSLGRRALALVDSTVDPAPFARRRPGPRRRPDLPRPACRRRRATRRPAMTRTTSSPPPSRAGSWSPRTTTAIRDLLCDLLRSRGMRSSPPATASTPCWRSTPRPFDLLLTDIEMPRVNGFQVIEHLKGDPELREHPGHRHLGPRRARRHRPLHQDGGRGLPTQAVQPHHPQGPGRRLPREEAAPRPQRAAAAAVRRAAPRHPARPGRRGAGGDQRRPAPRHEDVAVLFADIVGFTDVLRPASGPARGRRPHLQQLFEVWEEIACGLRRPEDQDHRRRVHGRRRPPGGRRERACLDCVRCGLRG